jgi:hypothetical protein
VIQAVDGRLSTLISRPIFLKADIAGTTPFREDELEVDPVDFRGQR